MCTNVDFLNSYHKQIDTKLQNPVLIYFKLEITVFIQSKSTQTRLIIFFLNIVSLKLNF